MTIGGKRLPLFMFPPDDYWGQAVTAVYVPRSIEVSVERLKSALVNRLSRFKLPKYWISVKQLPRNDQGKINYEKINRIVLLGFESSP